MITALSRFKSFAVVARQSSFAYKGNFPDVRLIAKELGVSYLLATEMASSSAPAACVGWSIGMAAFATFAASR